MKRTMTFILTLCMCLTLGAALTACDFGTTDPGHTHTYESVWSHDDAYHWYACEEDTCSSTSQKAEHNIENGTCSVCGYEQTDPVPSNDWAAYFEFDNVTATFNATITYPTMDFLVVNKTESIKTADGKWLWTTQDYFYNDEIQDYFVVYFDGTHAYVEGVIDDSLNYSNVGFFSGADFAMYQDFFEETSIGVFEAEEITVAGVSNFVYSDVKITIIDGKINTIEYNSEYPEGEYPFTQRTVYTFNSWGTTDVGGSTEPSHCCSYVNKVVSSEYLRTSATCENLATYYYSCECEKMGTEWFEYGSFADCDYDDWVEGKEATCGVAGVHGYYHCKRCERNYDENYEQIDNLIIPAKNHDWQHGQCIYCDSEYYTEGLTFVALENSTYSVGVDGQLNCAEIHIPARYRGGAVVEIYRLGFSKCENVEKIYIPSTIRLIEAYSFVYCQNLNEVYYNGNMEGWIDIELQDSPMFNGANFYLKEGESWVEITEIEIPNDVQKIGNYQFAGFKNLQSIKLHNEVEQIGDYAFYGCVNILEMDLPKSVEYFGNYSFRDCKKLKSIELPSETIMIGYGAFSGCTSLENMSLPFSGKFEDSTGDDSDFGFIFGEVHKKDGEEKEGGTVYDRSYYFGDEEELTHVYYDIPTSLKKLTIRGGKIDDYEFKGCYFLESINLSNTIERVGLGAFNGCNSLKEIVLPFVGESKNAESYLGVFGYIFGYNTDPQVNDSSLVHQYTVVETHGGITGYIYYKYYIPKTIEKVVVLGGDIKDCAFYNCGFIKEIDLLCDSKNIGESAFYNCYGLRTINIPTTVRRIGGSVFNGCSALEEIGLPFVGETAEQGISLDKGLFGYYFGKYQINDCSKVEQFISDDEDIATFYMPKNLKKVTVNGGYIHDWAFSNCNFDVIVVGENVTGIGYRSFDRCWFESIYFNAKSCADMKDVYPFSRTMGKVFIGDKVERIPSGLFCAVAGYNSEITEVVFSQNSTCKSIGSKAFFNCIELKSIVVPSALLMIEDNAFGYSNMWYDGLGLETVYFSGAKSEWSNITVGENNSAVSSATICFYSLFEPTNEDTLYWKYDELGLPVKWL